MNGINLRNTGFVGQLGESVEEIYQADMYFSSDEADGTTVSDAIAAASFDARFPVWAVTASANAEAGNLVIDSGNAPAVSADFDLGSGTVTDNEDSGGFRADANVNLNYVEAKFPNVTAMPFFSAAFWFMRSSVTGDSLDPVRIDKADGNYFVLNLNGATLRAHAVNGGTGFVTLGDITAGEWYYIVMLGDQNGACRIKVYEDDKTTLLYNQTITPNSNSAFRTIRLGRCDGTAGTASGTVTIKGFVLSHRYAYVELGRDFDASNYDPVTTLTASDDFAGDGALSGSWTDGRSGFARVGGLCQTDTDAGTRTAITSAAVAIRTGEAWNGDQECFGTIGITWDNWSAGVSVRVSGSDATLTGYGTFPRSGSTNAINRIVDSVITGGSITGTGGVAFNTNATTWANGDEIGLGVYGNSTDGSIFLYIKKNGTLTTDCAFERGTSPIDTGDPALWGWGAASAADPSFSDWEGANLVHG